MAKYTQEPGGMKIIAKDLKVYDDDNTCVQMF